jgi:hypothetical protein
MVIFRKIFVKQSPNSPQRLSQFWSFCSCFNAFSIWSQSSFSSDVYTSIKGKLIFKNAIGPDVTGYESSLSEFPSYLRIFISYSIIWMIYTKQGNPTKQLKNLASKEDLDPICTPMTSGEVINGLNFTGSEELIQAELLRFYTVYAGISGNNKWNAIVIYIKLKGKLIKQRLTAFLVDLYIFNGFVKIRI